MAVMIPSQNSDFDSKKEYYFSAPTSPSHLSQFYTHFHEFSISAAEDGAASATVPFAWEVKPGTPKSPVDGDDFVFDLSQDWETASLSAEELFDGGVIKPLKPPPPVNENVKSRPKNRGFDDPFPVGARGAAQVVAPLPRGRDRGVAASRHRAARSLSPLRDEPETTKEEKKWKLMDLFLFRSASEGRAADKDPLKKYTAASMRRSSFRAVESPGSRSGSIKRGQVSAHELHYTMNRAVSQDLKKKTFLPYKQGILGRLAFNPAVHALANGFGFSRK